MYNIGHQLLIFLSRPGNLKAFLNKFLNSGLIVLLHLHTASIKLPLVILYVYQIGGFVRLQCPESNLHFQFSETIICKVCGGLFAIAGVFCLFIYVYIIKHLAN